MDMRAQLPDRLGRVDQRARASYVFVFIASVGWLGLTWAVVGGAGESDGLAPFGLGLGALLAMIASGFAIALAFGAVALMTRLGRSDAYIAALSEATEALMQPDLQAADRVASVGHVVRREIAAMSDGVERAFSRTSELETVIRNEIVRLERVFGDNERRVIAIVRKLEAERAAILRHADAFRAAASPSASASSTSIAKPKSAPVMGDKLAARPPVAAALDAGRASPDIARSIAESAVEAIEALGGEAQRAVSAVTRASESLVADMRSAVAERGAGGGPKAEALDALRAMLAAQANRIEALLTSTATQLAEDVAEQLARVQTSLLHEENGLVGRFDLGHGEVVERLEELTQGIDDLVHHSMAQAQSAADQFSNFAGALGVAGRARDFGSRGSSPPVEEQKPTGT